MKHCIKILTVFFLFVFSSVSSAQVETINYVGSSTVGTYMLKAATVYKEAQFQINTEPESGGGENATASGNCDLGGVAREVRPEIMAQGVQKYLIGHDAIGVWIHKDNPLNDLTLAQLKGIFSGRIKNWKEVNGPDAAINIYIVNPQSATRKVFSAHVLGEIAYGGNIQTVRPDPAIITKIAADPHGIGQLSFAIGNGHPQVEFAKKIGIDGQKASVLNPGYPISRPLHLITLGAPKSATRAFIEWTLAPAGQSVVTQFFVGI